MGENLEFFQNLNYEVILRKQKKGFILIVPQLSCYAEGDNLDVAYKNLELEKNEYFGKMIENGFQLYIPRPKPAEVRRSLLRSLAPFFVKFFVIILTIATISAIAIPKLQSASEMFSGKISQLKEQATHKIPNRIHKLFSKLTQKIETMSPEQKEAKRLALRKLLLQIKPFTDECRVLFQDPLQGQSSEAK